MLFIQTSMLSKLKRTLVAQLLRTLLFYHMKRMVITYMAHLVVLKDLLMLMHQKEVEMLTKHLSLPTILLVITL